MATRFRALAAPIDASTGDRRRFAEGAVTHQPLPMPLRWVRSDVGGHDNAVTIGAIDKIEYSGSDIWVSGHLFDDVSRDTNPRLAEDVAEAAKLISEGVVGLSVDPDQFEGAFVRVGTDEPITGTDDPEDGELLVTRARLRSATLVAIPAFAETNHTVELSPDHDDTMTAVYATVSGALDLPIADRDREWDGPAATRRVFDFYTDDDGNVDTEGIAKAFLYRDPDADRATQAAYKLGYADIIDDRLTIVPRGVAATAGGRGVDAADIPAEEKTRIRSRICSLYDKIRSAIEGWPECPFDRDAEAAALVASVGALLIDHKFDLFTPPPVNAPTHITWDWDRGQVYGHIALRETCHVGYGECVTPPMSGDYRDFHTHPVETDEGTVYAGRIVGGGRHPEDAPGVDPGKVFTAHEARAHYDTMDVLAYVRATEDEFGIFVCGPITASKNEFSNKVQRIIAHREVSGDWRETDGGLSLVDVLALSPFEPYQFSQPGFPVKFSIRNGRRVALVASMGAAPQFSEEQYRQMLQESVTAEMARQKEQMQAMAALTAVMAADTARVLDLMKVDADV